MKSINLEDLIRQYVPFHGSAGSDWEQCVHTNCDHGRKGPRAGFIFNPDTISFNCFNCGSKAVINLQENTSLSVKFREILTDFSIPSKDLDIVNFQLMQNKSAIGSKKAPSISSIDPNLINLPKSFELVEDFDDTKEGIAIVKYLNERNVSYKDYPYLFLPTGADKLLKNWEHRVIVPIFKDDDLIFYQGRDITNTSSTKYKNASHKKLDKSKIISDYSELNRNFDSPLYIVEGWFDALAIEGIAIFGNNLHDSQAAWLNRSRRDKIYIPDRYGDGRDVAKQCLDRGWKISIPYDNSVDESIKDVSEMVGKYGKLFTMMKIKNNVSEGRFHGMTMIETMLR